ncbi:MAG: fluoride efflux transporter FluC [Coraliomargaritaceae bacterium]
MSFLLAAIGGALGGACRYLFSFGLTACCPAGFPWATLLVNAMGSFLLGVCLGVGLSGSVGDWAGSAFVAVGFCGGLTTFSTFSLEGLELVSKQQWGRFGVQLAVSLPLCMVLVWLGSAWGERLLT